MSLTVLDERNRRIGENVRKYRLLKGLTQDELADGICSVSQLSKVENGKTHLKRDLLKMMANRLSVPLERMEATDGILQDLNESLQVARDAYVANNFDKSLELIDKIGPRCVEFNYVDLLIDCVLLQCRILTTTKRYDESITVCEQLLNGDKVLDLNQRLLLMMEIGYAYEEKGELTTAFDYFSRTNEEFEHVESNDDIRLKVCFGLARSHFQMKNYRSAVRFYHKAERLGEQLSRHLWKIRSSYMRATSLKLLGEYDEAERIFVAVLREAEANGYLLDVGLITGNMGHLYQARGSHGQAAACFHRALKVLELLNEESYLCDPLLMLAKLSQRDGNRELALCYLDRVHAIAERLQGKCAIYQAKALCTRADLEWSAGNRDAYIELLEQAHLLFDACQSYTDAYQTARKLAELYAETGDPRTIPTYQLVVAYNDKSLGVRR